MSQDSSRRLPLVRHPCSGVGTRAIAKTGRRYVPERQYRRKRPAGIEGLTCITQYHHILIPLDDFERAAQLATEHLGAAIPLPLRRDPVPQASSEQSWFHIPDHPSDVQFGLTPLLLCSSDSIPLCTKSLSFDSIIGV
jgi:hypothetical protein